jgi:hypothetical protein
MGQTITFTEYVKVILPLDGFIFWVKADIADCYSAMRRGRPAMAPSRSLYFEFLIFYTPTH